MLGPTRALAAAATAVVLVVTGGAWWQWNNVTGDVSTSHALEDADASDGRERNILIMGLDSRLDKNGDPLPQEVYDRLHAGDEEVGGYNANTLLLLHIPESGESASIIGIPRDDYVALPGCPDGVCRAKIKESYGHAFSEFHDANENALDDAALEQGAREAGRKQTVATVSQFLGDVPIDNFVEVTMGAFYELAETVQPITVCLQQDVYDPYSGADFHAGEQSIDASEAMAFVRQRRDVDPALNFTDIDRSRRQQAFILSLFSELGDTNFLTDAPAAGRLLDIARAHLTLDKDFDVAQLTKLASAIDPSDVESFTLPISGFETLSDGSEVNAVDRDEIRTTVERILGADDGDREGKEGAGQEGAGESDHGDGSEARDAPLEVGATRIDVENATAVDGLAGRLTESLADAARDGDPGQSSQVIGDATTAAAPEDASTVRYPPGTEDDAAALARYLGLTATAEDPTVDAGALQLVAGLDMAESPEAARRTAADRDAQGTDLPGGTGGTDADPVPALSTDAEPLPTDVSRIADSGVACVK